MLLRDLFESPRTAVMAFGRMNPPTIGHQKLVNKIKSIDGDHYVFLTHSQKPKTDPLAFEDKLRFAKFFFPNITVGHPEVKTIIQALQKMEQLGYKDIVYVAGSDRVAQFENLLNQYNGKPDKSGNIAYNFNSIKIISAGERDPDADGAEGMSASKMRQAALDGDLESFKQGVPQQDLADEMFAAVRKGLGVKATATESIGSDINFPGFDSDEEKKKKKKKKKSIISKLKNLVGLEEAATRADADAMIAAIKTFQQAAGLKADGIVGPNTRAKAGEMIKDPAQAKVVTTLQSAIKGFQTKAGITADGKVGPQTMGAVNTAQGLDATTGKPAAEPADATTPAAKPQTPADATAKAGDAQVTDPNAQKAKPEDPGKTTPVNNKQATATTEPVNTTAATANDKDGTQPVEKPAANTAPEKPNSGSEYTLDGKPVSRDEYEKAFGKDLSGRTNDYNRLKNQIQGLSKKASEEKQQWTQAQLEDPDSPYYRGVPADKRDPDYPKELTAIDDKYAAEAKKLQAQADKLSSDPEVKKMIDAGGDKFDRALAGDDDDFFDTVKTPKSKKSKIKDPFADDPEGDAEFDRLAAGDEDDEEGTTTTNTKDGNTTSTSSNTSTVTRSGGTSTTKKVSGGTSTTRFSKKMKDGPDTAKVRAEKKELRSKIRAFADQYDKDNPDAGNFDYLDTPEYEALQKEMDAYKGSDGKVAQSQVVMHPSGTMDNEGNIKYNTKDGSWDGDQFDPDRKKKK